MQNDFGSPGGMFDRAGIDISGIKRPRRAQRGRYYRERAADDPAVGDWLGALLGDDRVKPPGARHALELVLAAFGEREARARDEILDGAGDEHIAGCRERRDAAPVTTAIPAILSPTSSHSPVWIPERTDKLELVRPVDDCASARHRSRRSVEAAEEAVSGGVHFLASEAPQLATYPIASEKTMSARYGRTPHRTNCKRTMMTEALGWGPIGTGGIAATFAADLAFTESGRPHLADGRANPFRTAAEVHGL
jgi:hypothetical protein